MIIKKIFRRINLSQGWKSVFKLSSGTILGQAISIIIVPILTRLYGPVIIGDFTLLNSISLIINSLSDLGLTNSIMTTNKDEDLKLIYKFICIINIIISVFSSIIYFFINFIFYKNFTTVIIKSFFLALMSIFLQQIQVCYTWINRMGNYNILMLNPIISNLSYGIISILLGLIGFKEYGYFLGWFIGQLVTLLHMKKNIPHKIKIKLFDIKYIVKNYLDFIKFQMPTNLIIKLRNQLPVFLISNFFGKTMVGYYSVTTKILQMPINYLGASIGRVFFKTISDKKRNNEDLGSFVFNNIHKVMKFALIPMFIIMAAGDIIIAFFLGQQWKMAGTFIRILGLQNLFLFLVTSCQGLSVVLNKQNVALTMNMLQGAGFIISFIFSKYIYNSIIIALILSSITYIIMNVIFFIIMFKTMNYDYKKYIKITFFNFILVIILAELIRMLLYFLGFVNSL